MRWLRDMLIAFHSRAAATEDDLPADDSAFWRRVDVPGHDTCRLLQTRDGWVLHGKAVFLDALPVAVDYEVRCDGKWVALGGLVEGWAGDRPVSVEFARAADGGWSVNGTPVGGLEDCVDLDFGFTPATNVLQLRRLALDVGESALVPVAWFDVSAEQLSRLEQHYERTGELSYGYDAPRFGYSGTLQLDANGFARDYPGLWIAEELPGVDG